MNDHRPIIHCPNCGARFPVNLEKLLHGTHIQCPACPLEMFIDKERSQPTLNAIEQLSELTE